jgi:hypothetical protein
MSNGTSPPVTQVPISLIAQTGMPSNYASRSKEIIYDSLQSDPRFVKNPFGPRRLDLSRPEHHW